MLSFRVLAGGILRNLRDFWICKREVGKAVGLAAAIFEAPAYGGFYGLVPNCPGEVSDMLSSLASTLPGLFLLDRDIKLIRTQGYLPVHFPVGAQITESL